MISLIAAVGKNREIGKNNALIWRLSKDLKYFKEVTLNHKIIMGYNTYLSIGKALPQRKNIVLVDDKNKIKDSNVFVYDNVEDLINNELSTEEECFIIGGASMYNSFYPLANKMYLTLIEAEDKDADTFFPKFENDNWDITIIKKDSENGINFTFKVFERE